MHSSVIMSAIPRLSAQRGEHPPRAARSPRRRQGGPARNHKVHSRGTVVAAVSYAAARPLSLFLFKRIATLLGTLIGASVIVFLVLEILPGNAAQMLMGPDASPDAVAALATKLGLDQPAWTRYWHWVGGMLTGN